MWQRILPASERADGTCRLDRVDETLIHLVHIARHELRVELMSYIDAARLLDRLSNQEREQLLQRASRSRLERAVRVVLEMTDALRNGTDLPDSLFNRLMPSVEELLEFRPVPRLLQLFRKLALLQGPPEFAGLASVYGLKQVALLRSRIRS